MPTVRFLDYDLVACDIDALIRDIGARLSSGEKQLTIFCLNPHSFITAERDPEFKAALRSCTYLIPDGIGIVVASRILGAPLPKRITGSDIFWGISQIFAKRLATSYFVGSTQHTLQKLARRLGDWAPGLVISGLDAPPFGNAFNDAISSQLIEKINASSPLILWVGMTAPKQEKWIARHIGQMGVGLAAGVGAVFDFAAGNKRRAPKAVQAIGLEWLFRLLREPRRLWRRTVVSGVQFMFLVLRRRLATIV